MSQNIVLEMLSRHFNAHPLISDFNGFELTAEEIHRVCAREMYLWCKAKNFVRLWVYLWINWYQPKMWILWARSAQSDEIPILKTTMILESHWRRIKHDYLHLYSRPRIDLVAWVLLCRVIPESLIRMHAVLDHDHRKAVVSWRKEFKAEWKRLFRNEVTPARLQLYHTNPIKWTCSCPAFVMSRFLVCKHIISCFKQPADRFDFFNTITRQRRPPFWTHPQLILLPQYSSLFKYPVSGLPENEDPGAHVADNIDIDSEFDYAIHESDSSVPAGVYLDEVDAEGEKAKCDSSTIVTELACSRVDSDDEFYSVLRDDSGETKDTKDKTSDRQLKFEILKKSVELVAEGIHKGNYDFVDRVLAKNGANLLLVREVEQLKNMRTMPRTWIGRHPATMYYR